MKLEETMNLSLDEFIRRKKAADSVSLFNMRKKKIIDIDKDELDRSLDEMVREKARENNDVTSSLSKFDRIRINAENDVDSDDDVEMVENSSIRFAKEIEKMDHPDCCKSKPFHTVEEKMKIKIPSQQWRLNRDGRGNLQQSNANGGRIQKNYRRHDNNVNRYVDRGSFTYKYQNSDVESDADSGIVGIIRNPSRFNGSRYNRRDSEKPIQINMNWRGFFDGVSRYTQNVAPPQATPAPTSTGSGKINLQIEAGEFLEYLKFQKKKNVDTAMDDEPFGLNNRNSG